MGYISSYKSLDNLCKDLLKSSTGVTEYITSMEKINNWRFKVQGWDDDYRQLKHYRDIRNQIVHENNADENNMCSVSDTQWLEQFYKRILNQTDPLALYKKSVNPYHNKSLKSIYKDFEHQNTQKKSGCYIATSIYGSYDCPQVWTLRRFRDQTLAKTWYGRLFIKVYYTISPTLVKFFGETKTFKIFLKPKLDRMVETLQSKGF